MMPDSYLHKTGYGKYICMFIGWWFPMTCIKIYLNVKGIKLFKICYKNVAPPEL
jgi:hypothetical protein